MDENFTKKFGKEIRLQRLNADLSQEKLAELSGLHRTYVGAVERGERNISLQNIKRIADALNIKVARLFEDL